MRKIWRSVFVICMLECVLMIACTSKSKPEEAKSKPVGVVVVPKFKIGDVVYLKPDSLQVVITAMNPYTTIPKYAYSYNAYHAKKGTVRNETGYVSETLIY